MLSEEEIIRNVKRIIEYKVISNYINNYDCRVIQGLLDLYYKQQKEIEEKNKKIIELEEKLDMETTYFVNRMNNVSENIDKVYISKDKIREKLNFFEHSFDYDDDGTSYELVMGVLNDLLEEN